MFELGITLRVTQSVVRTGRKNWISGLNGVRHFTGRNHSVPLRHKFCSVLDL